MKKNTLYIFLILLCSCVSKQPKPVVAETQTTTPSQTTIEDSYTTDTLYQKLPKLLQNLSDNENMEEVLAQNWINADDKEVLADASDGSLNLVVRSFSMGDDKTVVKNVRNYMETGRWKYDAEKKTIAFMYNGGGSDIYKIRALAADELRLTNIGINSETVLVFVSDGKKHKDKITDPFYVANNRWRIAPNHAETDEAIKQRVKDYLRFFILYYKDAVARRAAVVSFYGFPGCLKWYSGGIYMQDDKDILKNWEACFYNAAQANKGLKMVAALLDKKYTWPTGNINWIKKNLSVLEQMYANL